MGWTAYPELDRVLAHLVAGSQRLLGDNLVGVYLHGSLAAGDFNVVTSDVDFVVVTHDRVGEELNAEFAMLLNQLQQVDTQWAARLEGSFMPAAGFDRGEDGAAYPSFDEGKFVIDHKGIYNAMQRHTLREHGIALKGPAPASFIAAVSPDELKAETRRVLHGWWKPQTTDRRNLRERNYQAYAVLTMCRMLYTLGTGEVATKPQAAQWALHNVPAEWLPLVERAANWQADDDVDDIAATQRFIAYVLEEAGATLPS